MNIFLERNGVRIESRDLIGQINIFFITFLTTADIETVMSEL